MFEIYKTYSKVKDVFVKPKMKFHFGRWYMLPGLPVWRRGPEICLDRYGRNSYTPNNSSYICVGKKGDVIDGKELKYDRYKTSFHKLPKGTEYGAWTRPIRQKLRKMGLGWIKPRFFLPIWFTVDCFCYDVIYKWKYDEIRYEYPPQFTIVLFGLAITVQLIPDPVDDTDCPDHYWESLLSYLHNKIPLSGFFQSSRSPPGASFYLHCSSIHLLLSEYPLHAISGIPIILPSKDINGKL